MERVPDYWGKDLPVNKGRWNFDVQRFEYYRDATVALEAFKGGNYDFRVEAVREGLGDRLRDSRSEGRPHREGGGAEQAARRACRPSR